MVVPPLHADHRIDEYFAAIGIADDSDMGEIRLEIEDCFGVRVADADWSGFCGTEIRTVERWEAEIGSRYTFGHLTDFIGERLEGVSFAPALILGRSCDEAGAFRGIQALARQVSPRGRSFGPNTLIRTRLAGERLLVFWRRLRWITQERLLPIRANSLLPVGLLVMFVAGVWTVCMGLAACRAFGNGSARGDAIVSMTLILVTVGLWAAFAAIRRRAYTLPNGIRTFGDLARVVAQSAKIGTVSRLGNDRHRPE